MSRNKPRVIDSLKKAMIVSLPVLAFSGFTPSAMADSENALVSAAKSVGESAVDGAKDEAINELKAVCDEKVGNACTTLTEAKDAYSETKEEAEAEVADAESEVEEAAEEAAEEVTEITEKAE